MSQDITPLKSLVVYRARGTRTGASEIGNDTKQQNNNRILAQVIAHLQDASHLIHRVRIPYSKISSPSMFRNIAKSRFKVRNFKTNTILFPFKRADNARGPLMLMRARSSRNFFKQLIFSSSSFLNICTVSSIRFETTKRIKFIAIEMAFTYRSSRW